MSGMTRPTARGRRGSVDDARPAAANYHAHALARGLALLEILAAARRPLILAELYNETGLAKSTLVRLLSVLAETEYVVRVDDRPAYRLGHKLLDLSTAYVSTLDVAASARADLAALAQVAGHTANLGVLDGDQVLHLCVEEPDRPLRYTAMNGSRAAAYCTGLGKLLLAGLTEQDLGRHLPQEPYGRRTDHTITGLARLTKDLARIREVGYALDDNEYSAGMRCIAVPLIVDGRWLAAISVAGPSGEFDPDQHPRYLEYLHATARSMSENHDLVAGLRVVHRSLLPERNSND
jgi:DNA-binding IclR family transcriptional regulator